MATRRRSTPAAKWTAVRAAYVAGEGSLRQLARRFTLRPASVMERSASEGWPAERARVQAAALQAAAQATAASLSETLARHRHLAGELLVEVEARLRHAGELETRDLLALARTLDTAVPIERLAIGIETAKPAPPEVPVEAEVIVEWGGEDSFEPVRTVDGKVLN